MYIIIFVFLLVVIFILIRMEIIPHNVFVAFADDSDSRNESNYYPGLIAMDENILPNEFKVLINGNGLEGAGVVDGEFYIFKELKCGNENKLDYITIGNIVLLEFPERRLKQVFEVIGIDENDGLLSLAWYKDDEGNRRIFKYYQNVVIGVMYENG